MATELHSVPTRLLLLVLFVCLCDCVCGGGGCGLIVVLFSLEGVWFVCFLCVFVLYVVGVELEVVF